MNQKLKNLCKSLLFIEKFKNLCKGPLFVGKLKSFCKGVLFVVFNILFKRVTKRPMTLFFSTFSSALSSKSRSPLLTVDQPDSFLCIYRRCTAAPYPTSNHDDHYFSGQISSKALIQNCKCRNITPYQSTTGCNFCQIIHDEPPKVLLIVPLCRKNYR